MGKHRHETKKRWNLHLLAPALALAAIWLVFLSIGAKNEGRDDHQKEAFPIAKIDENILNGMKNMDYAQVKEKLNATLDFCLVVVNSQNSILLEKHPNGPETELCDGMI